ncbi:Ubiquitin carboxyl-terminal hydrolase calypso [Blattella germanica]|nr:Ubiquitin carboxyl-terminal hydrolase calypso [Blattella germanica]
MSETACAAQQFGSPDIGCLTIVSNQSLSTRGLDSTRWLNTCDDQAAKAFNTMFIFAIDDCRRTHNYDEFICTFLSMLAQQGKLADLVQQHLLHKKPGLPVTRVQRLVVVAY